MFCVEDAQKFKNKPPPPDEVFHFALLVKLSTFFTFLYEYSHPPKKGGGPINFRTPLPPKRKEKKRKEKKRKEKKNK